MCLLWTQTADTNFSDELLADFYTRNRDGAGFMWAKEGKLHYRKILPANAAEFIEFYNTYCRGVEGAGHVRMRTHGDINLSNCHPYEVFGFDDGSEDEMPMLLMHNGILHTGNQKDTSRSDTAHYIDDYIRKLLGSDPALAFSAEFKEIIGKHIGQNRFVLMNHLGEMAVINKYQGVEFNGAWLSNEYAWSASKYLPKKVYATPTYPSGHWDPVSKTFKYESEVSPKKSLPSNVAKIGKKHKKLTQQEHLPNMNSGGKRLTTISTATRAEKNALNGVSTDCGCLDDVLELRCLLDVFYPVNGTSNKQLECMIEEMGVSKTYMAVELLGDGYVTEKMWDILCSSRTEMRWFVTTNHADWTRSSYDPREEVMQ
jgi:predicted glutamine amidotransferase